jgi:hypothetical protein
MPSVEWLRYGALGLGLALAAYTFFLVRHVLKAGQLDTPHIVLLGIYMAFSLALAGGGFYTEYLAKHQARFSRVYARALLTESRINMRQDFTHCQAFLQRAALFLRAVDDDNFLAVEQDSRVADTRCGDGVNNVVPILQKYLQ